MRTRSTTNAAGRPLKETIERPNGVQIVTIRDRWGNVLKRSRIMPDGRRVHPRLPGRGQFRAG